MDSNPYIARWACCALLGAAVLMSSAAAEEFRAEFGIQGGFLLPDVDLSGKPGTFDQAEPLAGLRGGYRFLDHWGWFFDTTIADFNVDIGAEDVDLTTARTGIEWFSRERRNGRSWFVSFGPGRARFQLERASSFSRTFAGLSFGQR